MTKVNWQPMMSVNCTIKGCKGVLFSVPCSRIEESLGHQVFECDKCHQRYKLLTDGTPDAQVERNDSYRLFLIEYYQKNPTTGEGGWEINFAWVKATSRVEAKNKLKHVDPLFDTVITSNEHSFVTPLAMGDGRNPLQID